MFNLSLSLTEVTEDASEVSDVEDRALGKSDTGEKAAGEENPVKRLKPKKLTVKFGWNSKQ